MKFYSKLTCLFKWNHVYPFSVMMFLLRRFNVIISLLSYDVLHVARRRRISFSDAGTNHLKRYDTHAAFHNQSSGDALYTSLGPWSKWAKWHYKIMMSCQKTFSALRPGHTALYGLVTAKTVTREADDVVRVDVKFKTSYSRFIDVA